MDDEADDRSGDDDRTDDDTDDGNAERDDGRLDDVLTRVENPPDAVYIPTHREAMELLPTVEAGEYALSPMVTYEHRFWTVAGTEREEVRPDTLRGVHLMFTPWDPETGQVIPVDLGAEMRIYRDGKLVDRRRPWPMISQEMGFHFGDNVALPGSGTYEVDIDLAPITIRKTGGFEDRFEAHATASFEFEFDDDLVDELVNGIEYLPEAYWGREGALSPMAHADHPDARDERDTDDHDERDAAHRDTDDHDDGHDHQIPYSHLPKAEAYPGVTLGEAESGDAAIVAQYLPDTRLADDGYLLVSPRTPYNRVPLADVAISVGDDETAELVQTLDDELGLHYGIGTSLEAGDEIEVAFESPPQVSRHTGYETAFFDMPSVTFTVPE